ncbi:hypothetical protein [Spirosoma foliorum]|uniref:Lipoprotein n=1 Tax=Spirosoma foliorum TaxID=2710596 RepID=A0A7G5H147_9BACT|nr:hypothetical protein [Spirosoma foliorum]QMW04839.1 hypothetical protein H3H32_07960 [Spirosoma foliorum]
MKISFASGLLVRFLLAASFSSLVACSPVLQSIRLSKLSRQQPAEIVADVSPEAGPEPVSFMEESQQLGAEATYGFPPPMPSSYRWVFIVKNGDRNTPGLGHWVVKPNQ